jgi:hypothetical protein
MTLVSNIKIYHLVPRIPDWSHNQLALDRLCNVLCTATVVYINQIYNIHIVRISHGMSMYMHNYQSTKHISKKHYGVCLVEHTLEKCTYSSSVMISMSEI